MASRLSPSENVRRLIRYDRCDSSPRILPHLQPLRGQQQVHADRSADPADRHEQLGEVGLGGEQLGELVDDHEQVRQRLQVVAGVDAVLVGGDVGQVAGLP